MSVEQIYDHIDRHLDEHEALLQAYVRQPSVSVTGEGIQACADLVAGYYRDLGCQEVEILESEDGFPGIWAYYDAGAPLTIVNYNMYDVPAVGPEAEWSRPPFGAEVEPRDPFPRVLYGRGAGMPKGPYGAWLCALKSIIEVEGTLPVNIAFLAEGDEMLGSPAYAGFVDRYRERLQGIQGCLYLRATQNLEGELPLVLGYKGLLTFEVEVAGEAWGRGPTTGPVHSANKPVVDSPVWRLVHALATMTTPDGNRPLIDGLSDLWDQPFEPLPEDEQLIQDLLDHYQGKTWDEIIPRLEGAGVKAYADDLSGEALLRRYLYGSTFNIQGLYAGYTGPGSRTFTIPDRATALFDARLVTDLPPDEIIRKIRAHLEQHGFPDVQVRQKGGYPWSRTSLEAPLVQSFLRCASKYGGKPVIWPFQGFGGPWSIFQAEFGAPVVFATGIGHAGRAGLPDEFFVLDGGGLVPGLAEIEKFCVDLLYDFATSGAEPPYTRS
jgi:acetylornithine deacetylase/succinyl-diaminopimelate desuccinylase-like protein